MWKWQILSLWIRWLWFHVKSEWQKNSVISTQWTVYQKKTRKKSFACLFTGHNSSLILKSWEISFFFNFSTSIYAQAVNNYLGTYTMQMFLHCMMRFAIFHSILRKFLQQKLRFKNFNVVSDLCFKP